jgi:hypothetical protein
MLSQAVAPGLRQRGASAILRLKDASQPGKSLNSA